MIGSSSSLVAISAAPAQGRGFWTPLELQRARRRTKAALPARGSVAGTTVTEVRAGDEPCSAAGARPTLGEARWPFCAPRSEDGFSTSASFTLRSFVRMGGF